MCPPRLFVLGLILAPLALLLAWWHPRAPSPPGPLLYPRLWGDGVHDDTDAMEALVCKRKFTPEHGAVVLRVRPDGTPDFEIKGRYLLPKGFPIPRDGTPSNVLPPAGAPTYKIDCEATI